MSPYKSNVNGNEIGPREPSSFAGNSVQVFGSNSTQQEASLNPSLSTMLLTSWDGTDVLITTSGVANSPLDLAWSCPSAGWIKGISDLLEEDSRVFWAEPIKLIALRHVNQIDDLIPFLVVCDNQFILRKSVFAAHAANELAVWVTFLFL